MNLYRAKYVCMCKRCVQHPYIVERTYEATSKEKLRERILDVPYQRKVKWIKLVQENIH